MLCLAHYSTKKLLFVNSLERPPFTGNISPAPRCKHMAVAPESLASMRRALKCFIISASSSDQIKLAELYAHNIPGTLELNCFWSSHSVARRPLYVDVA